MIMRLIKESLCKGNDTSFKCTFPAFLFFLLLLPQRQQVWSGTPLLRHLKSFSPPESSPVTDYGQKAACVASTKREKGAKTHVSIRVLHDGNDDSDDIENDTMTDLFAVQALIEYDAD